MAGQIIILREMTIDMKANTNRLAYIGAKPSASRQANDWYTPSSYIEAVRNVLGSIELDPFSSVVANQIVQAKHILTEQDNAFKASWVAVSTLFCNPPYSRELIGKAISLIVDKYRNNTFDTGIVLVNNATETKWFQELLSCCSAVCFTNHRISFITPNSKNISNNTRGQVFFLLTTNKDIVEKFKTEFTPFGFILPIEPCHHIIGRRLNIFTKSLDKAQNRA